ncbi:uncharacterized protein DUF4296 [Chitinophaga niastensis]|uniref:Uncharacterized protein DUF4296 n=1 Tax=Chitinophaga niastensis TaxID=536980 RepID=A0A2P8HV74_CHINA|nr:DUF4296 domain-containing protein [Chitinophaga niastensis]PSL50127.1 uncharacterized protein DUF4296 [Chitinophaga niastensis]
MKNITKLTALAVLLLFLFACGDGDNVPRNIIPKQKMSAILADMSMADAYSNEVQMEAVHLPSSDSLRQEKVKILYKQILDLHKVSVTEFMSSYKYYESHPNRMKEVFQLVQSDISGRKSKLGNPIDENAPIRFRAKALFPYADSVILLPKTDTIRPFVKRQP